MTSFNGHPLEVRHRSPEKRRRYLPIKPCQPHPDSKVLLCLENPTQELRKKTYINAENRRSVDFDRLISYDRLRPRCALSKNSCKILIDHAKRYLPAPCPNNPILPGQTDQIQDPRPDSTSDSPDALSVRACRATVTAEAPSINMLESAGDPPPAAALAADRDTMRPAMPDRARAPRVPPRCDFNSPLPSYHLNQEERQSLLNPQRQQWTYSSEAPSVDANTYGGSIHTRRASRPEYCGMPKIPDIPFWKITKVLFWASATLGVSWLLYRGTIWTIDTAKACVQWVKDEFALASDWAKGIFSFM